MRPLSRSSFKSRERLARMLLVPLLALTVAVAVALPFIGTWGVDNKTYMEMVDGVRRHGLPYVLNGDPERFPEQRAAFNVPAHGKLWGEYPPLFAYVAAPAVALGGPGAVPKLNACLIGVLALVTFALGRRVSRDPLVGTASAYACVLLSPVWIASFETLAQPLMLVLITSASYAAVRAIDSPTGRARRWEVAAGVCGGLATSSHLLALPMSLALGCALGLAGRRPGAPSPQGGQGTLARLTSLGSYLPDRAGARRAALYFASLAVALSPLAALNAVRFGTLNPVSYGPCVWAQCGFNVQQSLNTGSLAAFAVPTGVWALLTGLSLFLAWRSPSARAVVVAVSVASMALVPALLEPSWAMARTVYGYLVDVSQIDFVWYEKRPDGFGVLWGHVAVKSLLQCTPLFALAVLTELGRRGPGARRLMVAFPVAGLVLALALLGRFKGAHALGWPYIFLRYAVPATPFAAVLAVDALRTLPWRRWHLAVGVLIGTAGVVWFMSDRVDLLLSRRVIELRVTLVIALVTTSLVYVARAGGSTRLRQLATGAASLCCAISAWMSLGVDTYVGVVHAADTDIFVRRFAELAPQRFALLGWGKEIEALVVLKSTRDVVYADLHESTDFSNSRALIDLWAREGRPVFAVSAYGGAAPLPDFHWPFASPEVPVELIDAKHGFWRIGPPTTRSFAPALTLAASPAARRVRLDPPRVS